MRRRHLLAVGSLFCAVLFAHVPSARAGDDGDERSEVVSINQESSEHGLKGCQHSGFPIQICRSGRYRLTSNLTVAAFDTDAIQIFANQVTLDLNGFSISGPWTATSSHFFGTGVYSPNSNLSIYNGTVTGFPQGIFVKGSAEFVERVTVTGNNYGIDSWGDSTFVDHATATKNTYGGIVLYGSGMIIDSMTMSNGFGILIGDSGGYGGNTIIANSTDVIGGRSMGTNACSSGKC